MEPVLHVTDVLTAPFGQSGPTRWVIGLAFCPPPGPSQRGQWAGLRGDAFWALCLWVQLRHSRVLQSALFLFHFSLYVVLAGMAQPPLLCQFPGVWFTRGAGAGLVVSVPVSHVTGPCWVSPGSFSVPFLLRSGRQW